MVQKVVLGEPPAIRIENASKKKIIAGLLPSCFVTIYRLSEDQFYSLQVEKSDYLLTDDVELQY